MIGRSLAVRKRPLRSLGPAARRAAAVALCVCVALILVAGSAYAAAPKLRLLSNGSPVPSGQGTAVITQTSFPGFTCKSFSGALQSGANPSAVLKFSNPAPEGGDEAFNSCETASGEPVGIGSRREGSIPKLIRVTASAETETVTEFFSPTVILEDDQSGCLWLLGKLSGPLPSSGNLEGIALRGTVKRAAGSARSCPTSREATAAATIEAAPEGAPPGSYEVERIP